jgi:hypothetical protein
MKELNFTLVAGWGPGGFIGGGGVFLLCILNKFFRDLVNISGTIFLQEGVFLSIYIFFAFFYLSI